MARSPKAAASEDSVADYIVVSHVTHDGEPYEPGDKISLADSAAAALIDVGAIKSAGKAKQVEPEPPTE